jgi:hypothetical protein
MNRMLHAEPTAADRKAAKQDARWFKHNPGKTAYERAATAGERVQYGAARIRVIKFAPGVHVRLPIPAPAEVN